MNYAGLDVFYVTPRFVTRPVHRRDNAAYKTITMSYQQGYKNVYGIDSDGLSVVTVLGLEGMT